MIEDRMTILSRVGRFLIWLLVFSWSMWLLRRVFSKLLRDAQVSPQQSAPRTTAAETLASPRRLVRDPICGMHVDEALSIPFRDGSELLHFCSIACRDAYEKGMKKFAANA
jgi:YHS domain-containing protein